MVTIREVRADELARYAQIPIGFEVTATLTPRLVSQGLGGIEFREELVALPYWKDYDAGSEGGPERWRDHFDITNWGFWIAEIGGRPMGGATVAFDTPGVHMLRGRRDLAVLWDIRVHPGNRHRGIGSALFDRAIAWSRAKGCRLLKVETQNNNLPACHFYAGRGCRLGTIDRYAYLDDPATAHEVMLIWYLDLVKAG